MGAATAKGYPYPVGTDRVMDGDNAIQALADKLDLLLPARVWVGGINVTVTNVAAVNTVVTFPAGRFTAGPRLFAITQLSTVFIVSIASINTTSATVTVRQYQGTAITGSVFVPLFAVQMLADAADG